MELIQTTGILWVAFGLGVVHALDADHIMAVTGLAGSNRSSRVAALAMRWAVGHGLTIMLAGAVVLVLGAAWPESLSAVAEVIVSLVLVALGVWVLVDLLRRRAHLHFHVHDSLPPHAHWHTHQDTVPHWQDNHRHGHGAVMIGVLHGAAGSAPLLVLLPAAAMDSVWLGLAYLGLFCAGVLLSMVIFGGLLGSLSERLRTAGDGPMRVFRAIVGLAAIAAGTRQLLVNI